MALIDVELFVNDVRQDLPECDFDTIADRVVQVINAFAEQTLIWRHTLPAMNAVQGQSTYTLTSDISNTRIIMPLYASFSGTEMSPNSINQLDRYDIGWRTASQGVASRYYMVDDNTLGLNRAPDQLYAGAITVDVALTPITGSTQIDDRFYNRQIIREGISHGTRHMLMQVQKKPWSNARMAVFHGRHFNHHLNAAASLAARSGTRAGLRFALRTF